MGYILVDLDHTLATYAEGQGGYIGNPVHPMVERVRRWLKFGKDVRIFTARASRNNGMGDPAEMDEIRAWCMEHLGKEIPIQCYKDFDCEALWDNIAVSVESNVGFRITADVGPMEDPLSSEEEAELMSFMYD